MENSCFALFENFELFYIILILQLNCCMEVFEYVKISL